MFKIFSVQTHSSLSALAHQLQNLGYELIANQDRLEIIDEVKASRPDLVLLDPAWGDLKGFQICETLKNDPETENIPIIFVHGDASGNGMLVKSFESGATDFISSETGEIELMARLKAAIRSHQTASQAITLAHQLNQMNTELYERNLQVEKDLYITRQLQQSLLPPILKEENPDASAEGFGKCHYKDANLKVSGVYLPCDALGGDIYDVIHFPNGTVGVAIADVSGHGVPAGFITAIFKSSFYRTTHSHSSPGDILFHLNNELADIVKTGEYVTGFYCRIQDSDIGPERHILEYSGAGHPYPFYYKASEKRLIRLQENGTPLIWVKNMEYPMGRIELEAGDKVLLFTDGLSEMRNPRGDMYGEEKLEESFIRMIQQTPDALLDEMIQELSDFAEGHPLEDDLSMVLIELS